MSPSANKSLLEIPDLPTGAFEPRAGRMRLFGKADAPAAPDYVAQANATAAGNLDLARAGASANRIDQSTPYGSINYTRGDGFDQSGYDQAMANYNDTMRKWQSGTDPYLNQYKESGGAAPTAPSRDQFTLNPDHWTSTIDLSPEQKTLQSQRDQQNYWLNTAAFNSLQQANTAMSQPFDMSGLQGMSTDNSGAVNDYNSYVKSLQGGIGDYNSYVKSLQGGVDPNTGMDAWDKATDLVRQRQNPELDRQQAALDAKLANMGLTAGSEGWQTQQQQFGQQRNDADIAAQQAGLAAQQQFFGQAAQNAGIKQNVAGLMGQGIGYGSNQAGLMGQGVGYGFQNAALNNTSRQQQLTERATLRQLPLQEINALRSAASVTNPTFSQPGAQQLTAGADLLGASSAQYNAAVNQTNAQNQQTANNIGAGVGAVATAISFY